MASILDTIVTAKRQEVALSKQITSTRTLEAAVDANETSKRSLANALRDSAGIIAEFKRASPSKGIINETASVSDIVTGYDISGASGISVLTDKDYFQAQTDDFKLARQATGKPILRKEFIVDEYQLLESKAMGADVVLLIAAVLSGNEIYAFTRKAHDLNLEVLLELHHENEIAKVSGEEDLLGVNNRDLNTFEVDIRQSTHIRKQLGNPDIPMISESGLSSCKEIEILLNDGFHGFLMGEYFMKHKDPIKAFEAFKLEFDKVTRYA